MQCVSVIDAEQRFADLLDIVQREPVTIRSHDEDVAVLVSPQDYEQIRKFKLEEFNRICEQASKEAQRRGLTEELLAEILADEDEHACCSRY